MNDINPYESPQTEIVLPVESRSTRVLLRITAYIAASAIGAKLGGLFNAANRIVVSPGEPSGYWAGVFFGGLTGLAIALIATRFATKPIDGLPNNTSP